MTFAEFMLSGSDPTYTREVFEREEDAPRLRPRGLARRNSYREHLIQVSQSAMVAAVVALGGVTSSAGSAAKPPPQVRSSNQGWSHSSSDAGDRTKPTFATAYSTDNRPRRVANDDDSAADDFVLPSFGDMGAHWSRALELLSEQGEDPQALIASAGQVVDLYWQNRKTAPNDSGELWLDMDEVGHR